MYIAIKWVKPEVLLGTFLLGEHLSEDQHWHCDKPCLSTRGAFYALLVAGSPSCLLTAVRPLKTNCKAGLHYRCIKHREYIVRFF